MPLRSYGVLAGRPVDRRREGTTDTPHYQIHLRDTAGTNYRAAVNVQSQQAPSELLYLADENFTHPLTGLLPAAGSGWTALASSPGQGALDYIRGNLFDPALMRALPPELPGDDNDLADKLDHYVQRAINDGESGVYVFGERWGPEASTRDKVFGFLPGNGVHDVHMNQGNSERFRRDDGVWQDGGILIHLPGEDRWIAIFLAFQSQAWHTDNTTGHTIGAAPARPAPGDLPLRIVAALVNPVGPAPEAETVTLLNASPGPISLVGWHLADQAKRTLPLTGSLAPGEALRLPVTAGLQLGNNGGAITLLDPAGLKVHGVSYTKEQAGREGWTLTF
ncbi:hypothetical protein GCM10009555_107230 [Acrocarpospora macrocephala]|uniref:LTD domain-containing protein n=1 Tax=Acrocarpospora macrocephala TaxID=150177 RepID=A0A5M3WZU5_9ACTN|nr:DUF2278 family protein [Acrocarpospora macrocephala]GES15035.1 hypothetical protein Amac_086320 [Acrocarpospora macrocephala]